MGWGAAEAFYEENSSWLDSPEDAYDVLYGHREKPKKDKKPHKCPICKKGFRSAKGADAHLHSGIHARRLNEVLTP